MSLFAIDHSSPKPGGSPHLSLELHKNMSPPHGSCQNFYHFVACWANSTYFKDANYYNCETPFFLLSSDK